MMPHNRIVIVGAGGAGVEALWIARRMGGWIVEGFVDDNPSIKGIVIDDVPILGPSAQAVQDLKGSGCFFHCAVGNNRQRERLAALWTSAGFRAAALIDPQAIVADSAQVGEGSYVGPLSIVAPHAVVGRHVLINTHVGVGHHAVVGDYAQLCPGVRVNGGCKIDRGAFLGSNAIVHPGLSVGEGASVGAGSFVIRSVKPRHSVLGVPARIVSRPAENGPHAQA